MLQEDRDKSSQLGLGLEGQQGFLEKLSSELGWKDERHGRDHRG